MKRYKKLFFFPFIIIIIITLFSGFGHNSNPQIMKELLEKRTSILQQSYFGQIKIEKAEEQLAEIETQPLLGSDIMNLRNKVPSEMDMIEDMKIDSLREITKFYSYLSYQSEITWYMKGLNSDYKQTIKYHIVLKNLDGKYKLSEFKPIKSK